MTKKILIVEDNELNRMIYVDILEAHDYTVCSSDGTDVYSVLNDFKPDIILMDILLPRESGFDIITRIRQMDKFKDVPAIALSAFTMKGEEDRYYSAGFNSFIQKPAGIGDLIKEVKKYSHG